MKTKCSNKKKIPIILLLTVVLTLFITYYISNKISEKTITYSKNYTKNKINNYFKQAFQDVTLEEIDEILIVQVDENNNVKEINLDINKSYNILKNLNGKFTEKLNYYQENGDYVSVPLGYLSNSPILLNLGPKIPIKVNVLNNSLGDINIKVTPYGINNALLEVYANITVYYNSIVPLTKETDTITYTSLIGAKIINGNIPSSYFGSSIKETPTFSLPINS